MGGGNSTKVEAAKRRRQNENEKRGEAAEVHLAELIGLDHRKRSTREDTKESAISSLG